MNNLLDIEKGEVIVLNLAGNAGWVAAQPRRHTVMDEIVIKLTYEQLKLLADDIVMRCPGPTFGRCRIYDDCAECNECWKDYILNRYGEKDE